MDGEDRTWADTMPTSARYAVVEPSHRPSHSQRSDPKVVYDGLDGVNLHAALGQALQLATLLRQGASPNAIERDGDRVPLHYAAARGHVRARLEASPLLSHANP